MLRATSTVSLAALSLGGCSSLYVMSHVPVTTMTRLSALNPLTAKPEDLRVAARLPSTLEPRPDGVKVSIEARSNGPAGKRKLDLVLVPAPSQTEDAALRPFVRNGYRLWAYQLSPSDAARLAQVQQEQQRDIAHGATATGGNISASVDACTRGSLPPGPLLSSTYLSTGRVAGQADYLTLVDDIDLRAIVSEADLQRSVPPCPGARP